MLSPAPPLHDWVSEELCGSCSWGIFLARALLHNLICVVALVSAFAEVADCLSESRSGTAWLERE